MIASAPGTLGRRVIGVAIDWAASSVVALLWLGGPSAYLTDEFGFTALGIFFGEITLLTWLTGSSFGQRLAGIAVAGIAGRPSLPRIALRTALVCLVVPAVVIDDDGRGLHDRAAGTIVVRRS